MGGSIVWAGELGHNWQKLFFLRSSGETQSALGCHCCSGGTGCCRCCCCRCQIIFLLQTLLVFFFLLLAKEPNSGGNFFSPLRFLSLAHPSHVAVRVLDGWLLRNASCTPAGFQLSFSFLLSPTLFFLCAHPSSSSRWDEFGQTRRGSESTAAPRRGPRVSFTENFKQQPRNVRELKQRVFRHGLGRYTRPSAFSNSTPSFECNNSLFYEDRASALMASCHRGIRGSAGKCGGIIAEERRDPALGFDSGQLR